MDISASDKLYYVTIRIGVVWTIATFEASNQTYKIRGSVTVYGSRINVYECSKVSEPISNT